MHRVFAGILKIAHDAAERSDACRLKVRWWRYIRLPGHKSDIATQNAAGIR
jgi:hypothetical protein